MNKKSKELNKQMTKAVRDSHQRMLDNALNQKVEVTCPKKLREMYPNFTDKQIASMSRLNHKINVANDFLIEEQSAWLDPSSRPQGGIPYNEDLFGKPFVSDEDNADVIQSEVYDEEN